MVKKAAKSDDRTVDFRYPPDVIQTCIGFADDFHKTIVREDGSLNYNFQREVILNRTLAPHKSASRRGGDVAADFGNEQSSWKKVLKDEDMNRPFFTDGNIFFRHRLKPIITHRDTFVKRNQTYGEDASEIYVTTVEEYENSTFSWTVFAYRNESGLRADVVKWELKAGNNFGSAPSGVKLRVMGERKGMPLIVQAVDYPLYEYSDFDRQPDMIDCFSMLSSGEIRQGVFTVVLEGELDPETVTVEWAERAFEETRSYWRNLTPFQNRFHIPDNGIMQMLLSCGRNILQAREVKDGVVEFQVGPTTYRGLWVVDGYFILDAAHLMGRGAEAFANGIQALVKRMKPDGSILIIPSHFKETAIAIATIVRQCELMNDPERLQEMWPMMLRALSSIRKMKEKAENMEKDYPARDLFPPSFLDGGISGEFPELTTPMWVLFGCKAAAEAGKRLGLPEWERFRNLYDEVLSGVHRYAQNHTKTTDHGTPYIPMNMKEREYDNPQSATWAFHHAIYPGEVFTPDDPMVTNLLKLMDEVDNTQGLPEETGWIHDQGLWMYDGLFAAQNWLYAGRADKAVDYLYACANHAAPNRVWREEQPLHSSRSTEICGDMPHNWASAEFIRLARNLIIMEKGENIELLAGLPEEWLPRSPAADGTEVAGVNDARNSGGGLVIEKSPTRFGAVTVELQQVGSDNRKGNDQEKRLFSLRYEREEGLVAPDKIILHWDGDIVDEGGRVEKMGDGIWTIPSEIKKLELHGQLQK